MAQLRGGEASLAPAPWPGGCVGVWVLVFQRQAGSRRDAWARPSLPEEAAGPRRPPFGAVRLGRLRTMAQGRAWRGCLSWPGRERAGRKAQLGGEEGLRCLRQGSCYARTSCSGLVVALRVPGTPVPGCSDHCDGPGKRPLDWLWEGNVALSLGRRPLLVHTRWPGPRGAPESPAEPRELSVSASELICRRDGHGWASPRAEGGPRAGVWHNSLERQLPGKRGAPRRHLPGLSPRGPEATGFLDGGRQKEPGRAAHGAVCGLSRSPPSRQNSPIPVSQGRWEHSVSRCVQSLARKQSHCHEPDWGPSSRGPQRTAGPAPGHTVPWCLRDSLPTGWGLTPGSGAAVPKADSQTLLGPSGGLARSAKCWEVPQAGTWAAPPATCAPPWGLQETRGAGRRPSLPALLGPSHGAPLCAAGRVSWCLLPVPLMFQAPLRARLPGEGPGGAAPGPPAGRA